MKNSNKWFYGVIGYAFGLIAAGLVFYFKGPIKTKVITKTVTEKCDVAKELKNLGPMEKMKLLKKLYKK